MSGLPPEPGVWRPYAWLAFGGMLVVGTPVGEWLLSWLYLGATAPGPAWRALHAYVQVFGFFATLIPGVAPHLFARFTGRPLVPDAVTHSLAPALAGVLLLRVAATALDVPGALLAAALADAAIFAVFATWVVRRLDPPPLALVRAHLVAASAWLALASLLEAGLRARALAAGLAVPDADALRAVASLALLGGVLGWILGILLRAGPMFVPGWTVPLPLARAVPVGLGGGAVLAAVAAQGNWAPPLGVALARAGEAVALGTLAAVALAGGAWRRARGGLPMLSRSPEERRIFRLAVACGAVAAVGSVLAAALAWTSAPSALIADALRHLLTVGVLTAVVVAMTYRLIPALERAPLPWPRARHLSLCGLLGGVVLRTGEVAIGAGGRALAPFVWVSGPLVWLAVAAVAANLVLARRRTGG